MKTRFTGKFYMRLSLTLAVLLWLIIMLIDFLSILADRSQVDLGIAPIFQHSSSTYSHVFVLIYYRCRVTKVESANFIDLLWRVFATGLVTVVISLIIRLFYREIGRHHPSRKSLLIKRFL